MLKSIVLILLLAMLASLCSGFYFLVQDKGNARRRLLWALGIRISLATALIGTIAYGIGSGQFSSQAPWDRGLHPERVVHEGIASD
ncbi:MAG: DUF2909 domain-containing protein [Cellvibrionales bacterium]|nr:DUF2909 domain-containing protein [Cellvibrionales bacterium]